MINSTYILAKKVFEFGSDWYFLWAIFFQWSSNLIHAYGVTRHNTLLVRTLVLRVNKFTLY